MLSSKVSPLAFNKLKVELEMWKAEFSSLTEMIFMDKEKDANCLHFTLKQWLYARAIVVSRNMQIPSSVLGTSCDFQDPEGSVSAAQVDSPHVMKNENSNGKLMGRNDKFLDGFATIDTIPIIVPLADLTNHSSAPNASWRINPADRYFELFTTSEVVRLFSVVP
jgi:hypothetical protein